MHVTVNIKIYIFLFKELIYRIVLQWWNILIEETGLIALYYNNLKLKIRGREGSLIN